MCGSPRVPAQTGILGLKVGVERGSATAAVRGTGDHTLREGQPKVHRKLILNTAQYHVQRG